jgi:hypothetical protein
MKAHARDTKATRRRDMMFLSFEYERYIRANHPTIQVLTIQGF